MKDKDTFYIGDVLSIVTMKALSDDNLQGVRKLVEFITGERIYPENGVITHEVSSAAFEQARQFILTTLPWTKDVQLTIPAELTIVREKDGKTVGDPNQAEAIRNSVFEPFLEAAIAQHGKYIEVGKIARSQEAPPSTLLPKDLEPTRLTLAEQGYVYPRQSWLYTAGMVNPNHKKDGPAELRGPHWSL